MAKIAARNLDVTLNSVAIEDELSSSELSIQQEVPVVTSFADAGPRRVTANYDYGISFEGFSDFAASQGDATFFGLVGSGGVALAWDPTGAEAGTNDPNYDSASVVLESYSLRAQIGQGHQYSARVAGNAALARATS